MGVDGEDCGVTAIRKDIRVFIAVVKETCIKVWTMVLWIRGHKWVYEKLCLVAKAINCWRVEVMW